METQLNTEPVNKKIKLDLQVKKIKIRNTIGILVIQVGLNLLHHQC